jgi:hypothetical protein
MVQDNHADNLVYAVKVFPAVYLIGDYLSTKIKNHQGEKGEEGCRKRCFFLSFFALFTFAVDIFFKNYMILRKSWRLKKVNADAPAHDFSSRLFLCIIAVWTLLPWGTICSGKKRRRLSLSGRSTKE